MKKPSFYTPKGWKIKKIPDVLFFQEGPGVRKWQFKENGVKLLNVRNINNGKLDLSNTSIYLSEEEAYGKYSHFLVDSGDLVIASSGIVVENFHNKIAFVGDDHLPLCMNTSTIRFKAIDSRKLNINFFRLFLGTNLFKNQLQKLITGSAQLNFGPSHLKKIKILLPPLDDQIRIATLLSRVEAMIATRKDNLRLLDEFLKNTFLEMFGDPVLNERGFELSLLDTFITHLTSGGRGWAKYYAESGKRFIRSLDVQMNTIGNDDIVFVNPPKNQEAERTRVQGNDILLTITGSKIGRVTYVPIDFEEAYISQHVSIIRTQGINPIYLSYYLSIPNAGQRIIKKMQYGQAKPGLNLNQIREFQILNPQIDLQNKFGAIVEKAESLRNLYQQNLGELESLYGVLSQKAFKGELDLSRIPLEKAPEETASDAAPELTDQFPKLDSYAMSDPASRERLLRQLFDVFISEIQGASFSLEDFWAQAEQKVIGHMDEKSPPLGVGDYDMAKAWLFDLLKSVKADQRFDEDNNRMELSIKG